MRAGMVWTKQSKEYTKAVIMWYTYTNNNIIICMLAYMYNEMIPSNMKREERVQQAKVCP